MLDFPSAPTNGQTYAGYVYRTDPGAWVQDPMVANVVVAPAVVKIDGGVLAATAKSVEIPLPASGYHALEVIGTHLCPTGVAAAAYSLMVQFSVAGAWRTGATAYAHHWDITTSTAAASAGWAAGSSTGYSGAMVIPYCYVDQSWTFFRMTLPQVVGAQQMPQFICDSHGYGSGAWTRSRTGGGLISAGGVIPDKLRFYFDTFANACNILAGFRWQLNGIK